MPDTLPEFKFSQLCPKKSLHISSWLGLIKLFNIYVSLPVFTVLTCWFNIQSFSCHVLTFWILLTVSLWGSILYDLPSLHLVLTGR